MIVNNAIVISDLHCGCQLGLCHPYGARMDNGGKYMPSNNQLKMWEHWLEFWYTWVPQVTRGEPYIVINNGDSLDGVHHRSVTQFSHNIEDQENLAFKILKPITEFEKCVKYFHLRGTEAHVGPSGQYEESLAKRLGACPDENRNHARWELWIKIGQGLAHITHHIGTTGSMAYETSAVHKELEQSFVEAGRWDAEIPDVIVRSHRHRNVETRIQTYKGFAQACTTAGWQLKTPFVFKIPGGRQAQPQLGGTLIRSGDEDVYTRHRLWNLKRPPIEIVECEI